MTIQHCVLELPQNVFKQLQKHLFQAGNRIEQAAFVFAKVEETTSVLLFSYIDWYALTRQDFVIQTGYHIELAEEMRPRMIKAAHDRSATLIEVHSHLSNPACFSGSDLVGFQEVVPHIRWRLGGKPYVAMVFARRGFDALVWRGTKSCPEPLSQITIRGRFFSRRAIPTRLTQTIRRTA